MNYKMHRFHDVSHVIKSMTGQHYSDANELAKHKDLCVDWDYYDLLSKEGICFVVTAEKDSDIVGYAVFCISNDAHSADIVAENSALYVTKEHRGRTSVDLLKNAEKFLHEMGVDEVAFSIKSDAVARFLRSNGYKKEYTIWSKKP